MAMIYYILQKYTKMLAKGKAHGGNSRGHQQLASKSLFPVVSHGMHLIPLARSYDNFEMLS
jgi:hypothetical protein